MAKVGVFGGSFNPIHEGHVSFLKQVKSQLNLDEVFLVVCRNALHKNVNLAAMDDRLFMCNIAIKGLSNVKVSDLNFEIDKAGYSIRTLQAIKNKNRNNELFLIVGPDSFLKINKWHDLHSILGLATIVSGYSNSYDKAEMEQIALSCGFSPVLLNVNLNSCHSTKIRFRFAQNLSNDDYLNSEVINHIFKNKIYSEPNALIVECENACKNLASKNRFNHCVMVAKMAVQLAKAYGENEYFAKIAGLLHDIVKEQSPNFLLKILRMDSSIKLSKFEKTNYKLWHAPAGAVYCNKVLGLENKQVLSAMACHTTGKVDMTNFEKIIYIADNISLDRKTLNAKIGRKMAFKNLNKTMLFHLKNHIQSCCKKNLILLDSSVGCYNQLILMSDHFKNYRNYSKNEKNILSCKEKILNS